MPGYEDRPTAVDLTLSDLWRDKRLLGEWINSLLPAGPKIPVPEPISVAIVIPEATPPEPSPLERRRRRTFKR